MKQFIVVTQKPNIFTINADNIAFVTPEEFILNTIQNKTTTPQNKGQIRVINLCSNYSYMSKGYYVSLLAEARGHKIIPSVDKMIDLNWSRLATKSIETLNKTLAKINITNQQGEVSKTFLSYFGRSENKSLEPLTREIFDIFRYPIISITIKLKNDIWIIEKLKNGSISDLSDSNIQRLNESLSNYLGQSWKNDKSKAPKYWLAVLVNKSETMPPSNPKALEKIIAAGKKKGMAVELIDKSDLSSLIEYDALFIRETTLVNHHTYRFANKALKENIPVVDDPNSIIKCSNKVYLYELLSKNNIPTPKTYVLDKKTAHDFEKNFNPPMILKIPDGAFSRGVKKASTLEEFKTISEGMLKKSDVIIVQEYMPTDYDWRVVILDNQPLCVCKYYMAAGHWQTVKHNDGNNYDEGGDEAVKISEAPANILKTALKACKLIGSGLYGVDMKIHNNVPYIIEINDNPNLDAGVEDVAEGDVIYDTLIDYFIRQIKTHH